VRESESVDVARRYSDAVKAGDYETAASLLDEELEVLPPSGRAYGKTEIVSAWGSPGFDHLEVTLEDRVFESGGDGTAVMHGTQVFHWKEGGDVAYTRKLTTRYAVQDGRILRMEMETV
jgi:ketosteroid isomerase-like protein